MIAITRAARRVSARSTKRNGPSAEAVVVVLRRDERRAPRAQRAVDVAVHEVRVDDVRLQPAELAPHAPRERRVEVARAREPHAARPRARGRTARARPPGRRARGRRARRPCSAQRRQQRQQVPLGAADPADPVDVDDPITCRFRAAGRAAAPQGRGRRQREQEVPRHAVARRPGEAHRDERLVGEERDGQPREPPRQQEERRRAPSRKSGIEYAGCAHVRSVSTSPPDSEPALRLDRPRVPEHPRRLAGELRLLAGVVAPELERPDGGRASSARTRPRGSTLP